MKDDSSIGIKIEKKTIIGIAALIIGIMVFAGILTQVVPTGLYDVDADGAIINGTYHEIPRESVGYSFWRVFIAPVEAFIYATGDAMMGVIIILVIILIGGTFLVLDKSGVMKYIMSSVVRRFSDKKYTLLAVMILACMALSSFAGIMEESVTLVPLAVAISLSLGWDSLVGLGFSLISVAFGYSAATFNPFNVGIVQSMADLPMFSGVLFRCAVFVVVYAVLAGFLITYAKKVEKDPTKSLCYESDLKLRDRYLNEEETAKAMANPNLPKATKAFVSSLLAVLVITVICLTTNIIVKDQAISDIIGYLPLASMAVLFTVGGLRAGHISGIKGKNLLRSFLSGAKTILPCAPIIIFIISVTYILKSGKIIDTLLYWVHNAISGLNPYISIVIIFFVICVFEFFISSGSAKAFLLMPILLPLVDMVGIGRQNLIVAFCLSEGFCNVLFPTNGLLMIALGMINLSYGKYFKAIWKLFVLEFIAAIAMNLIGVYIGY
ncbi:MAG: AbgT family transporter [Oscillospiraceae bacterium]|nr:AbgT family transporter [Oscillospiraceae bacterium]MDD6146301.1 AbgT family transporter [Oscillospiraceae bacterium]